MGEEGVAFGPRDGPEGVASVRGGTKGALGGLAVTGVEGKIGGLIILIGHYIFFKTPTNYSHDFSSCFISSTIFGLRGESASGAGLLPLPASG